ncbi:MAG: hypothetical protein AAGA58_04525 [Verrucomicrobiota bacterium]
MYRLLSLFLFLFLTVLPSAALPPEIHLPTAFSPPFPREPDFVNLSQSLDREGDSVYLLQTENTGTGNRKFFLYSKGNWQFLFSGSGLTSFGSAVQTRVVVQPDGTIVCLFAFKGTITGDLFPGGGKRGG